MNKKLPKTVTAKVYIHMTKYGNLSVETYDMRSAGWALLGTEEVTLNVPQVDVVALQLSALDKEKASLVGEYETKLRQIDEQIQNLRALSYDGDRLLREEDAAREQADRLDQAAEMQG